MKKFLIPALLLLAGPAFADSPLLSQGGIRLGGGPKTATAVAGAVTLNNYSGTITTESLTTAAAANYTLTITDNRIAANDIAFASIAGGTNSQGSPSIIRVTPGAGSLVVVVTNSHATLALNGNLRIAFAVFKN